MRAGEFEDGSLVLRAKIDMASPNINMRDPVLYRVRRITHHRTGDAWPIYPTYDYAHPISDAIEKITHSLCTLEFEDHRPLYDWLLANLPVPSRPQQIEFARLNLTYTVMSKRKLLQLVVEKHVVGLGRSAHADDRRPAPARVHAGGAARLLRARRRGQEGEHHRRGPPRVLRARGPEPARAAGAGGAAAAQGDHREPARGRGRAPRGGEQPRGSGGGDAARSRSRARSTSSRTTSARIRRRSTSASARARKCACATATSSGASASTRRPTARSPRCAAPTIPTRRAPGADTKRVQATIHWVSAAHGRRAEVRLYDRLFTSERPGAGDTDFLAELNPGSLEVLRRLHRRAEPGRRRGGDALPVRAPRLLRRRSRLDARSHGLQPHGHAARPVGEDQQGPEVVAPTSSGEDARRRCGSFLRHSSGRSACGRTGCDRGAFALTLRVPEEDPHRVRASRRPRARSHGRRGAAGPWDRGQQATSRPSRAGRWTAASRRAAAACWRSGRGDTCRGSRCGGRSASAAWSPRHPPGCGR